MAELRGTAGGRPITGRGLRGLAARHARVCIAYLGELVGDDTAPAEARVTAAQELLRLTAGPDPYQRSKGAAHGCA